MSTERADSPSVMRGTSSAALKGRLRIPLIVAPMFQVSTPTLVVEACRAGVIGAFPHLNAKSSSEFEDWLDQIESGISRELKDRYPAPYAINLLTHGTNPRFAADLEIIKRRQPNILIASVGTPEPVIEAVHAYGGMVFADVVTLRHARRCAESGVDGLVLLCAGSGGQTGRLSPFAFVEAVRNFYEGLIAVAGGITRGSQVRALEKIGADFAYVGTSFIAARESSSSIGHKQALCRADIDDVWDTDAVSGIPGNVLRESLERLGLTPKTRWIQKQSTYDWSAVKSQPEIYSCGHGVGAVMRIESCKEIVQRIASEYEADL